MASMVYLKSLKRPGSTAGVNALAAEFKTLAARRNANNAAMVCLSVTPSMAATSPGFAGGSAQQ